MARRLNKFIDRLESGVVAFGEIVHPDVRLAQRLGDSDLDCVWFATEHDEQDYRLLSNCLAHMISRPRIRLTGDGFCGPTPMIGLPRHAGARHPWMVTQALDLGFMMVHQARVQTPDDVEALVPRRATRSARRGSARRAAAGTGRWAPPVLGMYRRAGIPAARGRVAARPRGRTPHSRHCGGQRRPRSGGGHRQGSRARGHHPRHQRRHDVEVRSSGPRRRAGLDGRGGPPGPSGGPQRGLAVGTAAVATEDGLTQAVDKGYTFVISRGDNYVPLNLSERRVALAEEGRRVRPVE